MTTSSLMETGVIGIQKMMTDNRPIIFDKNKLAALHIACPNYDSKGEITYYHYGTSSLPESRPNKTNLILRAEPNIYDYKILDPHATEWHVNFADKYLFGFYGGSLFAQDEMQVTEHPCLASFAEMQDGNALTISNDGKPTPWLLKGVERKIAFHNLNALYGNNFTRASIETIQASIHKLDPPTISNIIAMAAPQGSGVYTSEDITYVLQTAYTAFLGAKEQSNENGCTIHTVFWGCGAFGGNKPLMVFLQIVAAKLAEVDYLIFHTFNEDGLQYFGKGLDFVKYAAHAFSPESKVTDLIQYVASWDTLWGRSDGN